MKYPTVSLKSEEIYKDITGRVGFRSCAKKIKTFFGSIIEKFYCFLLRIMREVYPNFKLLKSRFFASPSLLKKHTSVPD